MQFNVSRFPVESFTESRNVTPRFPPFHTDAQSVLRDQTLCMPDPRVFSEDLWMTDKLLVFCSVHSGLAHCRSVGGQ